MKTIYNPLNLSNKTILLTGASSGIGRATSIVLSKLGAELIICGRRLDALKETLSLTENQSKHHFEIMDLTAVDDVPTWLKSVVSKTGRPLDGLVHCAGVAGFTPIRTLSRKAIDNILMINLYAAFALLRGMSMKDVAADGSSIVLISSVASLVGQAGLSVYSASKGALNSLVRCAAVELSPRRIRVNCIAPGLVGSGMLEDVQSAFPGRTEETVNRHLLGTAKPEDVAILAAYLLSDAARVVTGVTIPIDGGFSCC